MNKYSAGIVACALAVGGCANTEMSDTQKRTATGAGIGAAAGAVLGAATGDGNKGKRAATGAVIGGAVGAAGGYIWSQRMEKQKAEMEQATAGTGIDVQKTADNRIKVSIPSDAGFDTGQSYIKPQLAKVLQSFAQSMQTNPNTNIEIIGHTDSTGSDAINDPLSRERAISTRDYLTARGVAGTRVAIEGRGSREPIASNNTDSGRSQNRRVEIYVAEPA